MKVSSLTGQTNFKKSVFKPVSKTFLKTLGTMPVEDAEPREVRIQRNVDHARARKAFALRWMGDRTHPPRFMEQTILDGGARLGMFWSGCKTKKRCTAPPYNRLLTNSVLRADYRITQRYYSDQGRFFDRATLNVHHLRASCPL